MLNAVLDMVIRFLDIAQSHLTQVAVNPHVTDNCVAAFASARSLNTVLHPSVMMLSGNTVFRLDGFGQRHIVSSRATSPTQR